MSPSADSEIQPIYREAFTSGAIDRALWGKDRGLSPHGSLPAESQHEANSLTDNDDFNYNLEGDLYWIRRTVRIAPLIDGLIDADIEYNEPFIERAEALAASIKADGLH